MVDSRHPPCRFCDAPLRHTFVDLGASPMANSYVEQGHADDPEVLYPLHVYVCERCFLVQLREFESPEKIFGDYAYFSSYSDSWLAHAKAYVEKVVTQLGLGPMSRVMEIASNDGYLLRYFKEHGIPVLGIEPARNVAEAAQRLDIPTRIQFFGTATARKIVEEGLQADLLIGNNVLAHVPELNDFVVGMKIVLAPDGVITMEFPHLLRLMRENQFDTIYHEHFSYFSFLTAERVFARHGLRLFDVEELPTHGGSLRIYACHADNSEKPSTGRTDSLRNTERSAGLDRLAGYSAFAGEVKETKRRLLDFMTTAKRDGKQVVGYGAPAKGNTLLNYCGIRQDLLEYTVDRNPHKQGRLLPGSRIPIFPPERIPETRPDYILILPWNLKEEIMTQLAAARSWGAKFVVPIPVPTIYS